MSAEHDPASLPFVEPLARRLARWRADAIEDHGDGGDPVHPENVAPTDEPARRPFWRRSGEARPEPTAADPMRVALGVRGARWVHAMAARTATPVGWVVDRAAYDELVQSALPAGHELPKLLSLAGSALGQERCARAHDRLLEAPLPERMRVELAALSRDEAAVLGGGLCVVSCLVVDGDDGESVDPGGILPPIGPLYSEPELRDAIRSSAAATVLHLVASECAQAGATALSLALLLVPAGTVTDLGSALLAGAGGAVEAPVARDATDAFRPSRVPLTVAPYPDESPTLLTGSALEPLFAAALGDLGRRHGLDQADGRALAVLDATAVTLEAHQLRELLQAAPRTLGELLLVGLVEPALAERREPPSRWDRARALRVGLAAARGVGQSTSFTPAVREPALSAAEPPLVAMLDGLAALDLAILPTDALGTSLENALAAIQAALSLWLRARAAEVVLEATISALVRTRVPDASILTGVLMAELGKATVASELADELAEASALVAVDHAAASALHAGVGSLEELPAGATRGSLLDLASGFRDWCAFPWELGAPRWGEDAGEIAHLVRAAAASSTSEPAMAARLRPRQRRANALAAGRGELARYEPALGTLERIAVRALLGRLDDLTLRRRTKDRALLRALALARRVVREVDQRLARHGARTAPGGALLCALEPLRHALETDTLELGRQVRMRQAEQRLRRARRAASSPEVGDARAPEGWTGGGASPGTAVGRACVVRSRALPMVEPGAVLVVHHLAPTWGGLAHRAAGVVSAMDLPLSPAAQLCRALGVPMVCGVPDAARAIASGERLRIDGSRGTVERLGP